MNLEGKLNLKRVAVVVIALLIGTVAVFAGNLIVEDALSTHQSRTCDAYTRMLTAQERAMTMCYNDPFCRLAPEDWEHRAFLRGAAPRACAGLPALIVPPADHQSSPTPFPFTFPPETTAEAQ